MCSCEWDELFYLVAGVVFELFTLGWWELGSWYCLFELVATEHCDLLVYRSLS